MAGIIMLTAIAGSEAFAQKKYDTGATDTEIKLGNIIVETLRSDSTSMAKG